MTAKRKLARQLAAESSDPLTWFETLYQQAAGDSQIIPWADLTVNPNLSDWLQRNRITGDGRKALVVGGGLGDDAETLAALGFAVTAFDISPTCIDWCRQRFPESSVEYEVADLFSPLPQWRQAFDFVLESYTLQVLPPNMRTHAAEQIAACLAPGGTLLVIARGRDEQDDAGQMPWPLLRSELSVFESSGLREVRCEDYLDDEDPPVRRFRVEFRRNSQP